MKNLEYRLDTVREASKVQMLLTHYISLIHLFVGFLIVESLSSSMIITVSAPFVHSSEIIRSYYT